MKLVIGIVIAIIVIAIAYWWFIWKPANIIAALPEESTCKKAGLPGTIINGICVPIRIEPNPESIPGGKR